MNEEFIKLFYEESQEQLEAAEEALVSYEQEQSIGFIEEAFRSLHTIKGAANMFGFTQVGDFSHKVENILDEIKDGKIEDAVGVASRLIIYVDHLKNIITDPTIEQEENQANHQMMMDDLDLLIRSLLKGGNEDAQEQVDQSKFATFYLHIQSKIKIEENSGHPVLGVIRELGEQGLAKINPHLVDHLYDYWDIYLANDTTADEIEMNFMFYDSDVEVKAYKLSGNNLFGNHEFESEVKEIEDLRIKEKLARLTALIDKLTVKQVSKQDTKSTKLKSSTLRVSSHKVELLMNSVSELVTELAHLALIAEKHSIPELEYLTEKMERHILNLRDATFDMSLVPVSTIVNRLQRIVRDASKELSKEIDLVVKGGDIEIDKSFLELLADPFMHILRNAIDHGIELPEDRVAAGKASTGTVTLQVYRSGADVVFNFIDDGRGLDQSKIISKAIERGIIASSDKLSEKEIFELIFHPGFSTANQVTSISGRGVGMDVVRTNIQELKGSISIASKRNQGTTFTIKVPLTLSIVEGLLFRVEELYMLVPLNEIAQCHNIPAKQLAESENDLQLLDGDFVPVINLRDQFGIQSEAGSDNINLIQVISNDKSICLTADEIIGEFQAVIKPVGEHYSSLEYLAGATILGDGSVALVLETNKLKSLLNHGKANA